MAASRCLYLYRRHIKACEVHAIDGLTPSSVKYYKACECPIWITGVTTTGVYVERGSTGLSNWAAAEAYMQDLNKGVATEMTQQEQGTKLEVAVAKFLSGHEKNAKRKTLGQHKVVLNHLTRFAASNNVVYSADLTYDLCKSFLDDDPNVTKHSENTQGQYRSKLKVFLKEALRRDWITKDIAGKIDSIPAHYEAGEPYTDEQLRCIFAHALKMSSEKNGYASNGKTFQLLLDFMLQTGLRISDAVRYNPKHCVKSQSGIWKYRFIMTKRAMTKADKICLTFLPESLKSAIDKADWFSRDLPFAYKVPIVSDKNEREVYARLKVIGKSCNVDDSRPHRFRDTFAVRKLEGGMLVENVSRLLHHEDVRVTRKHYAKWTTIQEDNLEAIVKASMRKTKKKR
jgi:site-specific recombinase XerD